MPSLVSLERLKQALRIFHDDEDATLELYISAASAAVINYLKDQAHPVIGLDDNGDLPVGTVVPDLVQLATIFLVGRIYENPDNNDDKAFEMGYLPWQVTALLYPLRDPAFR